MLLENRPTTLCQVLGNEYHTFNPFTYVKYGHCEGMCKSLVAGWGFSCFTLNDYIISGLEVTIAKQYINIKD